MKKLLVCLAALIAVCGSTQVKADSEEAFKLKETPVYRLYNNQKKFHFFTKNMNEVILLQERGYVEEGYAFSFSQYGETVYRMYDPKDKIYFYTQRQDEVNLLKKRGWKFEGGAFRSYGNAPVYRMFHEKRGRHFYTRHLEEYQSAVEKGYRQEGIAFYTLAPNEGAVKGRSTAINTNMIKSLSTNSATKTVDRIHFLDRFEMSSEFVLLESNGRYGLLDAGYENQRSHDYAINYLKSLGVTELDFIVLTHYDEDHWTFLNTRASGLTSAYKIYGAQRGMEESYLGSSALLDNFKINRVIMRPADPKVYYEQRVRTNIEATLRDYQIPVTFEKEFSLGDYKLSLFNDYPLSDAEIKQQQRPHSNFNSLAVLVEKENFNFLFSGDVEENDEMRLAEDLYQSGNYQIHLMTAGHHGLGTSNSKAYLDMIGNPFAAISNSEKHLDPKGRVNVQEFQERLYYGDGTVIADLSNVAAGVDLKQPDTGRAGKIYVYGN